MFANKTLVFFDKNLVSIDVNDIVDIHISFNPYYDAA